jgi:hypothetical protein
MEKGRRGDAERQKMDENLRVSVSLGFCVSLISRLSDTPIGDRQFKKLGAYLSKP